MVNYYKFLIEIKLKVWKIVLFDVNFIICKYYFNVNDNG